MPSPCEPLVCTAGNSFPFRVLPAQRCGTPTDQGLEMIPGEAYACKNAQDQGLVTLDRTLRVRVKELLYPGDTSAWIVDKWIYVLKGKTFVAEIHADDEQSWELLPNPDPSSPNDQRSLLQSSPGFIALDPGPEGSEYSYDFFLSPIRLTPNALQFLLDNAHESCVSQTFKRQTEAVVPVPDPFHWAADAHNQFYMPRLERWEQLITDPEQQAKVFIAGVLSSLLQDDKAKIKNKLTDGEPKTWLQSYTDQELALRKDIDEAAAYLFHCVDSVEHYAVELAGMDTGDDALACCYVQWGTVAHRVLQTQPGRQFAANVVGNPDRLPMKYLFADSIPVRQLNFESNRYAWLAALTAFENLSPAKLRESWVKHTPPLDRIRAYLQNVGVNTKKIKLSKKETKLARKIAQGNSIASESQLSKGARPIFEKISDALLPEATELAIKQADENAGKFSKFVGKIHDEYKMTVFGTKLTLGTLIEIINVSNAVGEYLEATGNDKGFHLLGPSKARNVVGAIGDLTVHVCSCTEEAFEEELGAAAKGALGGVGGAAGFVSGAVDMLNFEEGLVNDGLAKNDFATEVGKTMSAIGSAGIAVMGGMALAGALLPETLPGFAAMGPAGWIAGVVFAVLVIGGCLIVAFLADNPYQQFAGACFLGKDHGTDNWFFPWAPAAMGDGSAVGEARNLLCLLSAFQLTGSAGVLDDELAITINPGYLNDDCVLEVKAVNRWRGIGRGRPLVYTIMVVLNPDDVIQLDGPYPLYPLSFISRNRQGDVDRIEVCTAEQYPGRDGKGSWINWKVWVRMRSHDGFTAHPAKSNWVRMDIIEEHAGINSLDQSKIDERNDPTQETNAAE